MPARAACVLSWSTTDKPIFTRVRSLASSGVGGEGGGREGEGGGGRQEVGGRRQGGGGRRQEGGVRERRRTGRGRGRGEGREREGKSGMLNRLLTCRSQ